MSVHLLKCGLRPALRQVMACNSVLCASVACTLTAGHRNRFSTRSNHIHHLQQSMNTEAVGTLINSVEYCVQ